jgi:hypothetical protein
MFIQYTFTRKLNAASPESVGSFFSSAGRRPSWGMDRSSPYTSAFAPGLATSNTPIPATPVGSGGDWTSSHPGASAESLPGSAAGSTRTSCRRAGLQWPGHTRFGRIRRLQHLNLCQALHTHLYQVPIMLVDHGERRTGEFRHVQGS